jgi:hypothetical protein
LGFVNQPYKANMLLKVIYNLKMMFVQNQQPVKPQPLAWEDVTVLAYLYTSTIANMNDH